MKECSEPAAAVLNPQSVEIHHQPSQALLDPIMEKARAFKLYDDFKYLADLSPKLLTGDQKKSIEQQAQKLEDQSGQIVALQFRIESLYEHRNELLPVSLPEVISRWTVKEAKHRAAFEHTEKMWKELVRQTPPQTRSSLIPLPFPVLIPGARFQEGYYWDTFFAFPALLHTGRERLVRGQIDNFLFLLQNYGMIPNGTRDYYLSRSQPPLISEMVRVYIEHLLKKGTLSTEIQQWLKDQAYPWIKRDYEMFWMNPNTRYHSETGLNKHYDSEETDRPERHSTDQEEQLAKTKRDVRAEAESGKDFTDAFEGEASHMAGVLLNSLLYKFELNLSWMAEIAGAREEVQRYQQAAQKRKKAMNEFLWDREAGIFRDYNLRTQKQSAIVTADIFAALSTGLADTEQSRKIAGRLPKLERAGGLMSSEKDSGKQWDAPYGWAPHHFFAIDGLVKYNLRSDAERLARKWVHSVETIFHETGQMIEKIDAVRGNRPLETGNKYPTQDGFLWTNGVYVWALTEVLGLRLVPQ